jgi:hypothetical protein
MPPRSSNVLIGFGKAFAFAIMSKPNRCGAAAEVNRECTRWRTGSGVTSPVSMLDAELNDFGAQLAMFGGHAANRDG